MSDNPRFYRTRIDAGQTVSELVDIIRKHGDGSELGAEAWSLRQIEKRINRYLNKEEVTMEPTAKFIVKSIHQYEKKWVALLQPVHPDDLPLPDGIESVPDSVYESWYDDMFPAYRLPDMVRDEHLRGRFGGECLRLEIDDECPWFIGEVVELSLRGVGHESELTEPLEAAVATKSDAA